MAKSMKTLNCEHLLLSIEFDEKIFKRKEFVLDTKPEDENQKSFGYSYGNKSKTRKEHAHFRIVFDGKDSYMRVAFHQGKSTHEDVRESYLEDFAKWISGFFVEKELTSDVNAIYRYDKKFEPVIQLNYPILIANELFQGALVSGYEIDFPETSLVRTAIISSGKESTLVMLHTRLQIDLSEFEYHNLVETVGRYAEGLMIKKGGENGKRT